MTWVVWRQYRAGAAIAGAALAAFAALMLFTGLQDASRWHGALLACEHGGSCGPVRLGSTLLTTLTALTLLVPLLFGMFWGSPAVGRERETGTVQFAWTQSVTRRRWLAAKAGWLLLAGALYGGAVAGIVTWWYGPLQAENQDQFAPGNFDILGIAPVGYALFAVALGIAAGAVLGRSLPAVALTGAVYAAVRVGVTFWVRQHYLPPVTAVYSVTRNLPAKGALWQLAQGVVLPGGQYTTGLVAAPGTIMSDPGAPGVPGACPQLQGGMSQTLACMARLGYRAFTTYQPGYRFWPFQFIEAGLYTALAAVLVAAAFAVVKRKDA